jgi:hypothetical protein
VDVGGTFRIPNAVVADVAAHPGSYFVQFATAQHPAGALRGQLAPDGPPTSPAAPEGPPVFLAPNDPMRCFFSFSAVTP